MPSSKFSPYLINVTLLIIVFVLSVAIGSVYIPPLSFLGIIAKKLTGVIISQPLQETFSTIIWQIRLPHTLLVLVTGAALSGSGAAYQGLFRNPLADPYLIGVASGAGLGAILAMVIHWPSTFLGLYAVPAAAFMGALVTVVIVYSLSRVGQSLPTTTLILAGVAVGSFATALTSFLMLRSTNEIRRAISWLLGGGILSGWMPLAAVLPYVVIGLVLLIFSGHILNVLQFGEEQAQQLGINIERAKKILVFAASLTTAAAVAFSGIIGFIGLIVPHLTRMLWGPDYRRVIPLSILGGGTALMIADIIARALLAPQVLPVGVVTALAGAPFFLWVLRRSRTQAVW